jgi:hypothetical protein
MKPVTFEESNIVFAKDQPEYIPLPAWHDDIQVISCWELDDSEIETLRKTKRIWLSVLTFGNPLQPQCPMVQNPFKLKLSIKQPSYMERFIRWLHT